MFIFIYLDDIASAIQIHVKYVLQLTSNSHLVEYCFINRRKICVLLIRNLSHIPDRACWGLKYVCNLFSCIFNLKSMYIFGVIVSYQVNIWFDNIILHCLLLCRPMCHFLEYIDTEYFLIEAAEISVVSNVQCGKYLSVYVMWKIDTF